jgi:hypothetical protein
MSSLIFYTDESQVLVATDTLATSSDGAPFMFTSNAFVVPHLRFIMAGTGMGGFLGKWFVKVNDKMIVKGIEHLDYHTPSILLRIWKGYKKELSISNSITTTVYHLGFSEEDQFIRAYAYRSINNFRSEPLSQYGLHVKPECDIPEPYQLPADFKTMMNDQRAKQFLRLQEERLYIGGEIQIHHLTRAGFSIYTLDKFDDFAEQEDAIYENFKLRQANE